MADTRDLKSLVKFLTCGFESRLRHHQRMAQRLLFFAAVLSLPFTLSAIDASNAYRSPRNPERAVRSSTELIVLHTTEAPAKSSLNKLSDRGECHFCVTEEGRIYRIVDRDREAFHAGRSMWNGKEDVDKFSIGIECVGYHDKEMSSVQLGAIRDLVTELKSMYHLSDERVVTHSQVAYGMPNKWQKKKHRGRKRCGMLFAMPSVREFLGLKSRMKFDPDTRAKRLVVGDDYLQRVLYGNVDTMKAKVIAMRSARPTPQKSSEESSSWFGWLKFGGGGSATATTGAATKSAPNKPAPQKKSASVTATKPAPKVVAAKTPRTIAELKALPGYAERGRVMPGRTAAQIAGAKWNKSDTYYVIRDKIIPGDKLNPAKIEKGMAVWFRK